MRPWDHYEKTRNICCWTGVITGWAGTGMTSFGQPFGLVLWLPGLTLDVMGDHNQAKVNNRRPAFCLWALLAPIEFLGLALLKDKWGEPYAVARTR